MSIYDKLHETEAGKKALAEESLILNVCERLYDLMEQKRVSKTDLAKKLRVSKGRVSKLLSGQANMTLRTLADLGVALDTSVRVDIGNEINEKIDRLVKEVESRSIEREDFDRDAQKSKEAVMEKFVGFSSSNEDRYQEHMPFQAFNEKRVIQ